MPWDLDLSFRSSGPALPLDMSTVNFLWPLIRNLYDDSTYRAAYDAALATFYASDGAAAALQAQMQSEHDLVAPHVVGVQGEIPALSFTNPALFEAGFQALLLRAAAQAAEAAAYLGP